MKLTVNHYSPTNQWLVESTSNWRMTGKPVNRKFPTKELASEYARFLAEHCKAILVIGNDDETNFTNYDYSNFN